MASIDGNVYLINIIWCWLAISVIGGQEEVGTLVDALQQPEDEHWLLQFMQCQATLNEFLLIHHLADGMSVLLLAILQELVKLLEAPLEALLHCLAQGHHAVIHQPLEHLDDVEGLVMLH